MSSVGIEEFKGCFISPPKKFLTDLKKQLFLVADCSGISTIESFRVGYVLSSLRAH